MTRARRLIVRLVQGIPRTEVLREALGRHFTPDEAKAVGEQIGITWEEFSLEEFRRGLEHEWEHAQTVDYDLATLARLVQDHLRENPDYYTDMAQRGL